MTDRIKGERYRPVVTVEKQKKGKPTVIKVSGRTFVVRHRDQWPK